MHAPDSSARAACTFAPTLSRIRSLQRLRAARDASQTFWIEGVRQFLQAVDAGFQLDTIVHSRVLLKSSMVRHAIDDHVRGRGVTLVRVTPEQFRAVPVSEHASGVGAIVRQRWAHLHHADATRGLC